jgi:hypothetical protein
MSFYSFSIDDCIHRHCASWKSINPTFQQIVSSLENSYSILCVISIRFYFKLLESLLRDCEFYWFASRIQFLISIVISSLWFDGMMVAKHMSVKILSALEVVQKVEIGSCLVCDESFTLDHALKHKGIWFKVIDGWRSW